MEDDEEVTVRINLAPHTDETPKVNEDLPPLPEAVTFTYPSSWLNMLSYVADCMFAVFCCAIIIGFFMFVAFGIRYFVGRMQFTW